MAKASRLRHISALEREEIAHEFEEHGYRILRAFLEDGVVAGVRTEIEKLVDYHAKALLSQGRVPDLLRGQPFETRYALLYEKNLDIAPKLFRNELHLPGFFDLFFHPGLLDVVELILGPEVRLYPNYTVRPKVPEWEGARVLWHQDGGYTQSEGVGEMKMVNVWTPLVPATTENGCMQFVPGTHKLGLVPHEKREHYLEIAEGVLRGRTARAMAIELDPGDVVIFNNLLFHQGLPNHSKGVRWSLDWRYQDAGQPTLRAFDGHLARSKRDPSAAVRSAEEWSGLVFS